MHEIAALYRRDLTRLIQQVEAFAEDHADALWRAVPGISNPAGNLALHLEGNLREYIGRQLGGIAFERRRDMEFGTRGLAAGELVARLRAVRETVPAVVEALRPEQWNAAFPEPLWGEPLQTGQVVVHLLGHLNYHLGQIDYLRRVLTGNGAIALAALANKR